MTPRQPSGRAARRPDSPTPADRRADDRLRQVLELGEDLLGLAHRSAAERIPAGETLLALRSLFLETVDRVLGGRAALWLSPELVRQWTNNPAEAWAGAGELAALTPLMAACLEAGQACYSSDGDPHPVSTGEDAPSNRVQTIAAPLAMRERGASATPDKLHLLGVVQVEAGAAEYGRAETELLEALAIQAALALHASLQTVVEQWRLRQLGLVRQVAVEIAELRDVDDIVQSVAELIQQTFDYYCVNIFTLDANREYLRLRASAVAPQAQTGEAAGRPELAVRVGDGIIGYVADSGNELVAADVSREPRYRKLDALPETRSEAALPLRVRDRRMGVLDVQSDQPDDFNESDMLVLRALATTIALSLEDARLITRLRTRASQLEMLYRVSSAITSILEQEALLVEVARLIQERFGYPYVHLYSVHPGRRKLFYEGGSGPRDAALREQNFAYDLDDPHGILPWVARHGETVLANDVSQEPRYRPSPLPPEETLAELAVPLVFGSQVLGVLDVQSDRLNAFSEEDRYLFEALADHVAIALRNAALYRTEVWRRGVNDSLREVAGLLSADVDLDQVLQAILAVLGRTLPQHVSAIWLTDTTVDDSDVMAPALHLAAVQGERMEEFAWEAGLTPAEVLDYNPIEQDRLTVENAAEWLQEALLSDEPVVRRPDGPCEPLGVTLGFPQDYSAIAAPLRVGDQALGVLVLAHRRAGKYGSEAGAMSAAFASSAAVAIENARLYEAAHEQAWVSTVLLQVANATQTITNLNELLATVIHITPMLAGVKACLLYILDEDGDFVPAAASGLEPEAQTEFERWRFATGDVTALDRLLLEKAPVFLHGDQDDQRLTGILSAGKEAARDSDLSLTVLVPMLARGEVLGAFLVDYSASPAALSGRSLEAFFDERLAILQGIAHQTAIAVDNIHLLKSQKEEAYVSVALLQVAQAVVSSNDLDEALGSIVRITPILVGVKRALVFLWDETHRLFRLAQAYGIPRSADLPPYGLDEFPLLDAVLLENAVLAHPLWSELSNSDDVPEVWTSLTAPDLDQVDEYLENAASLLLAFPLSVRGKVRGVFLVEEPEPAPGEGFGGSNANRRLRAKRLEIITGISQQAALAIENDVLQREMFEQERLEREMQLAREIQRAFLPQVTPELPGWDLKMRWRPAREVGGDFYDFFELPGRRLGLVIADVADKGMPAALFMTLVRTLIRATVREIDSPADVLERANDIIVPDAPRGMFVTIFYAVLDLDTGVLDYANAGHNQPLLLRREDCQIELLARGGMALGVLEGTQIKEGHTTLHPGDYLVLYTDGVTEAFSTEYEPFGEERLQAAVSELAACVSDGQSFDAEDMLARIDDAVQKFIGDAQVSDDLTLMVLRQEI